MIKVSKTERQKREHFRQYHREYAKRNEKKIKIFQKEYRRELRLEVLSHYSDKSMDFLHCACCKELHLIFLTIDHINNDGAEQRRKLKLKSGFAFYLWLKQNNYPEGYQVLCHNCNYAKSHGGCPHKKETT